MIHLQICQGTTCYVMGAAHLASLATDLPEDLRGRVHVTGCRCLGLCRDGAFGGAPYVTIDGAVLSAATTDSILSALRARIQGDPPVSPLRSETVRATGGSPQHSEATGGSPSHSRHETNKRS